MLNISFNSIANLINTDDYSSFRILKNRSVTQWLVRLIILFIATGVVSMFLPWTQNIRTNAYVTTLNPFDKPQSVQSMIGGRIERWNVQEGDIVSAGDTLLWITEAKEEYLDPQLLDNTVNRIDAKKQTIRSYESKMAKLREQYNAVLRIKENKLNQNEIKLNQLVRKIQADSIKLEAQQMSYDNTLKQFERLQQLYDKGLKSLTDLENLNTKLTKELAELNAIQNQLQNDNAELENLRVESVFIANDYDKDLAKIQSEIMSASSSNFQSVEDLNKLNSDLNKFKTRSDQYFVVSPVSGTVTRILKNGIGEFIKAGEEIMKITPTNYELAVEMYVLPRDVPLLQNGQDVRILFDGWPAIIFSGWPDNSYGTFNGKVVAIDYEISNNQKYRVLVAEDPAYKPWPELLRMGGGAQALVLLNEVPLYYEIWRRLNGFPPDFYGKMKPADKNNKAPLSKIK